MRPPSRYHSGYSTKSYKGFKLTIDSDNAGILGITVASDKTIIGEGSAGIIQGKGLRIVSGASNIIIQYIQQKSPV
jgi:pectate lyase